MMEAILNLKPQHTWIQHVSSKYSVDVKVLQCKYLDGIGVQQLFEIYGPDQTLYSVVKELTRDEYVKDVEVLRVHKGRLLGSLKTRKCVACRLLAQAQCFLTSFCTQPDGSVEWILLGSGKALIQLIGNLKNEGVDVAVRSFSSFKGNSHLTARQEKLLQTALEKGYFDFPRRIRLENLASLLDVAPSTLSEVLRRGMKKILKKYFADHSSSTVLGTKDKS